ncbi:uncharacterized protein LOC129899993 isoform X3 [Solanum dulcamara]|uniref:uncharacterized protein LOC129899993 isoform X3 n=1 Tax=Solanum dulcamara TaxID=45834 RepID=UPI0024851979|nr:uncharacterized protein LOC129899993 isoform X3 [Solanum dulcamara]
MPDENSLVKPLNEMGTTNFHTKFGFSSLSPFIQKVVHLTLLTSAKSLHSSNKFNPIAVFSLIKAQHFSVLPTKPLNHLQDSIFFHSNFSKGMLGKVLVVLLISGLAWAFPALLPPPPRICGSPDGPTVTGPRIKLRDGRHLAYKEHGVPKEKAKYKDTLEELGAYVVSFDRPGYGESDPLPERTIQTTALDMEELADQLGLGPKFYVMGFSMGGHSVWGCLKYIPNRLAGAALVAPVVNYWWPSFPDNLSTEGYNLQLPQDQWALRVAHYAPWLVYWWNTQKWFPCNSVISGKPKMSPPDLEVVSRSAKHASQMQKLKEYAVKQGVFESLHRDMMVGFGKWDFDPMDLKNLFPNGEGSVHLWHGDEDWVVPVILQRYVAERLPWIHFHEIPNVGHLLMHDPAMKEVIWKTFLPGEKEQIVHS